MADDVPIQQDEDVAETGEPIPADEQDFAVRNVSMSNALPTGASPAAGAVSTGRELGLEPTTDEERALEGEPATGERLPNE
ncbi:MAG: hypothetical protein M3N29_02335 [Chloroflexota bacterium]|nr:hypothetical protein [Chloroflexota bacterium]